MEWIVILILVLYVASLSGRVKELEDTLKKRPVAMSVPQVVKQSAEAVQTPNQSPQSTISPIPPPPTTQKVVQTESKIIRFFKEDFLVKLGAFLLVLAFGWALSYAFINNWIGPAGRIALGFVAGIGIIAFGTVWLRKNFHQAGIFLILGLTVLNLTVAAARFLYEFFTPASALGILFLGVAYVAAISVQKNSQNLALTALVFGAIAPLLTAGEPSVVGLFSYLLVYVLGALWVVYIRGWHALTFAALLVVSFYSLPHMFSNAAAGQETLALLFAFLFGAVFYLFNAISMVRSGAKIMTEHIWTALGTGLFLTAWILTVATADTQVFLLSLWAVVYMAGALMFLYIKQALKPFYLYGATSLFFIAVATALHFDGSALTLAYTIETGLVLLLTQLMLQKSATTIRLSYLFAGPILLSLGSFVSNAWDDKILHQDFFVILTLTLTLGIVGMAFRTLAVPTTDATLKLAGNIFLAISSLYALLLLLRSLSVHYDGEVLAIAFIIESAVAILLIHAIFLQPLLTTRTSYILGIGALLTLTSFNSDKWLDAVWHVDLYIPLAFGVSTLLIGWFLRHLHTSTPDEEILLTSRILIYASVVTELTLVWLIFHAVFDSADTAVTLALILYTICGLTAYVQGRVQQIRHLQYAGGALLTFVVGRLLIVEVWNMPLLERVITFFLVGILLISTAFYGRTKKPSDKLQ